MPLPLENLTVRDQLRLDRLPLRTLVLLGGLTLFGASVAMMMRASLGVAPWDVFHVAVARHVPFTVGTVMIATSAAVLLLWIPLRQRPGLGTLANALWIGPVCDITLHVLGTPSALGARVALLVGGIALNALGGALYIGAQLGTGPRDGLMTGLHRRLGWPIGGARLGIELAVLVVGWLLGGPVGVGTVCYAIVVGPLTHVILPRVLLPVRIRRNAGPAAP